MSPIPIAILAAGASRRLGEAKQLVPFRGRSLLSHAIATALEANCGPVLVILGARAEALRDEVIEAGALAIENLDWETGLGSSIRSAIEAIESSLPEAPAVLFLLCDQPMVTPDLLNTMIRTHRSGHELVAAAYDGVIGVPALFGRRFFDELRELTGDSGARRVLARYSSEVFTVPFAGAGLDVDTPADLDRLAAEEGS